MTYREIALQIKEDNDRVLWLVGEWLGNEGQRAIDFPDAEPLDFDPESMWEAELQEYLEGCGIEL